MFLMTEVYLLTARKRLNALLLHNENKFTFFIVPPSVYQKKNYKIVKLLLEALKYKEYT